MGSETKMTTVREYALALEGLADWFRSEGEGSLSEAMLRGSASRLLGLEALREGYEAENRILRGLVQTNQDWKCPPKEPPMSSEVMTRVWAMPNRFTFQIRPIRDFIDRHLKEGLIVDPFCGNSRLASSRNDLRQDCTAAQSHLPADVFLRAFGNHHFDGALFDPPYSPRQMQEVYHHVGLKNDGRNATLYSLVRKEIDRVLRPGGIVLSFGWNSSGFGRKYNYERIETLLVCHGGAHNDTICVAERKPDAE